MRIPVNKPYRDGPGYGAWLWYGRHRGKDFRPAKIGAHQAVVAPEDGTVKRYVGGSCAGVDFVGKSGVTHRLCHLHTWPSNGLKFKEGQRMGSMGNRGLSRGVHLHWATLIAGRTVNPLSLVTKEPTREDFRKLFKKIWRVAPTEGDLDTFYFRYRYGGKTRDWVIENMKYWYGVVYPGGKLNKEGDAKWQRHKAKILGKYG